MSKTSKISGRLLQISEYDLMVMDGYDDCIVGVVERFGQKPIVCYDKEKVLCRLEADGMDRDEAEEFFYFNQIGAWMGDSTPCFLSVKNSSMEENTKLSHSESKTNRINIACSCIKNEEAELYFRESADKFPTASVFWDEDEGLAELMTDEFTITFQSNG